MVKKVLIRVLIRNKSKGETCHNAKEHGASSQEVPFGRKGTKNNRDNQTLKALSGLYRRRKYNV
jgi:hypothetical protein